MFQILLRAIFQRLSQGLDVPVYDYVPEGARLPYVTLVSPWSADNDGLNFHAERGWIQVSSWSDFRGFSEVTGIDAQVDKLLHGHVFDLPDGGVFQLMGDNAHALRDIDPRIRQVAHTFYIPFFYIGRAPTAVA